MINDNKSFSLRLIAFSADPFQFSRKKPNIFIFSVSIGKLKYELVSKLVALVLISISKENDCSS